MKQRGEVAGKLPAVLCPRKRKQHPAAPRGAKMQKHSAKGWHCARAEAKEEQEGKMENSATGEDSSSPYCSPSG